MSIYFMDEESRWKILNLYLETDLNYQQIADRTGKNRGCVISVIRRAIEREEIKRREKPKSEKATTKTKKLKEETQEQNGAIYEPDGIVVNCTKAVSKKCLYGAADPNFLCDYYSVTGVTRLLISPDHTKCTCFTSRQGKTRTKKGVNPYGEDYFIEEDFE